MKLNPVKIRFPFSLVSMLGLSLAMTLILSAAAPAPGVAPGAAPVPGAILAPGAMPAPGPALNQNPVVNLGTGNLPVNGSHPQIFPFALSPGPQPPVSNSTLMNVQKALSSRGYSISPDGALGATTQNAIREFQAYAGISQTGLLDDQTLRALNVTPGMTPTP